jgi:hypothetical protein
MRLIQEKERRVKAQALINAFSSVKSDKDIVVISDLEDLDRDIFDKAQYLE